MRLDEIDHGRETWFGIFAPAGNAVARQALVDPDTKRRWAELGTANGGSSLEQLDAYIKCEIAKWPNVIKDANIQV